jgi:hypothetical protein
MTIIEELIRDAKSSKNAVELFLNPHPNNDLIGPIGLTEKSTLGNILKYTNGMTVDDRFLRIFGAEDSEWTDSIKRWNNFPGQARRDELPDGCIVIGYDVLGGFFAINGGAFGDDLGKVFYFGPDSLVWENLNMGHTQFIGWCLSGNVRDFYRGFRWDHDQLMIDETKKGQGISSYPFLWSQEGKDLNTTSKKIVALREIWGVNLETKKQLGI